MDLESVHRELDLLAMQNLELTQDLVNAKLRLEQNTKDGHFLLAKARYGGTRADRTRLPMAPSEDEDNDESKFFEANVKLERSECLRKESNVRFNYLNIIDKGANSGDDTALLNRKGSKAAVVASPKGHDPLKWFGVLVPQTLRQSADRFGSAARIGVECANIQSELRGVEDRKKYLMRMLTKKKDERDEE